MQSRDGECPQAARLHVRIGVGEYADDRRYLAAEKVLDGGRTALVRQVDKLETGSPRQRDAKEMRSRPGTGRAIGGELRVRPAPVDELRQCCHVRRHHRPDSKQEGEGADGCYRDEVLESIVVELLVDVREERDLIPGRERQKGAVGLASLESFERDASTGPGPVVDDHGRGVPLHVLDKQSRNDIERSTWGKAHREARVLG